MDFAKLKKINDYQWEIPKAGEMRVPGWIFASEPLMKEMDEMVYKQVSNVACLPGIQKASIAMPDAHWGYGFPIGGVGAFDADEGGVISVGGVGFDVNCLPGKTRILTKEGYHKTIEEFEKSFEKQELVTINLKKKLEQKSRPILFLKKVNDKDMYKITTKSGHEINVTEDHPVYTDIGMLTVKDITEKQRIAVFPFEGVKYEEPNDDILLSENDLLGIPTIFSKKHLIDELKKRNLLPLRRKDPRIPALIKLVSYNMGDGSLVITANKGTAWFWGRNEDLEQIREDIKKTGYTPSKIYSRKRNHNISTRYGNIKFTTIEYSIKVTSRSFVVLLNLLGTPIGRKADKAYGVPEWLFKSPKWHKRLYLAAYFGAEMSSPKTMTYNKCTFYMPAIGVNKCPDKIYSGRKFLDDIARLLEEFDIKCAEVGESREEYINEDGKKTYRLRLFIAGGAKNLLKLYKHINFEYNREKRAKANIAIQYILLKEKLIAKRIEAQKQAVQLYEDGKGVTEIAKELCDMNINKRFIIRSIYEGRKTSPRIAKNTSIFEDFAKEISFGKSGAVWDDVEKIEKTEYKGYVYDFTVNHTSHNFIADDMVVSNCGITTLKTNLFLKDVKPKIKELMDTLFRTVPAGLGSRGEIVLSGNDVNELLMGGAEWVIGKGYGFKEDLDFIEEHGKVANANPANVSELAMRREKKQVGTLGSGNHYLEVQYVDEIFDKDVAKKFGLEKEQIIVSIHCGSRALGHQIGTDYLKTLADASRKYNIPIMERELVCAPINSDEGQTYLSAVNCAINYAFANRQVIAHLTRKAFSHVFKGSELKMFYNIGHNTVKLEKHIVDGKAKKIYVHRKGSTRAFGPGREELPKQYQGIGQPVIIGGTMGTESYILHGTDEGEKKAFSSVCHGAGRTMSRNEALRRWRGNELIKELESKGIYVKAHSLPGLAEEAPGAYKDVIEVVDAAHHAGLSKKVVMVKPLGCIKG